VEPKAGKYSARISKIKLATGKKQLAVEAAAKSISTCFKRFNFRQSENLINVEK